MLGGHSPKPRPKQLGDVVDRLLAAGTADGESAFTLPEKELKRLCSAARWAGGGGRGRAARDQQLPSATGMEQHCPRAVRHACINHTRVC